MRELAYDSTCCLEYRQHQKHASACFPEVPGAHRPGFLIQFISAIDAPYQDKRGACFSLLAHMFPNDVSPIFLVILIGSVTELWWLCLFVQVYGPPSTFNTSVISQLGRIATQLSVDELASLKLSEIQSVSAMGAINIWTSRQVKC